MSVLTDIIFIAFCPLGWVNVKKLNIIDVSQMFGFVFGMKTYLINLGNSLYYLHVFKTVCHYHLQLHPGVDCDSHALASPAP